MFLHTVRPVDGSIPFGVNYRNIRMWEKLSLVIGVRERYELNFLKLCIARAKHDLDAVLK
jgi:hypothetical protein